MKPKQTTEIRYNCAEEHRKEIDRIVTDVLGLNLGMGYLSLMEYGLAKFRESLMSKENTLKIIYNPNAKIARILFENGVNQHEK